MLEIPDGAANVTIDSLTIKGRHAGGWTNGQMAAIGIRGMTAHDITITGVAFRDLPGFSVHNEDGGQRINVTNCTFTNCGNGLNVNADDCAFTGNVFTESEGIEAIGTNTLIEDNTFTEAWYVAISIGGDGSGRLHPGIIVRKNIINSVIAPTTTAIGILISDGCDGASVYENLIRDTITGIDIVRQHPMAATQIIDPHIYNNDIEASYNGILLNLQDGISGIDVDANKVRGAGLGIECYADNARIHNNDLIGAGSFYDLWIGAGAVGTMLEGNLYDTILDQR